MNKLNFVLLIIISAVLFGFKSDDDRKNNMTSKREENFKYQTEQFADLGILRYQIPGFNDLTLKQKTLVYYLYEAALSGRDIFYDQNYKHNLLIRKTLEAVVISYKGDKKSDDFNKFMVYTKRFWFSNGIHHHYSASKILPEFTQKYFAELLNNSDEKLLPLKKGESVGQLISYLTPLIFDPAIDGKKTNLNSNEDLIKTSAGNFYEGVSQKEVEDYHKSIMDKDDPTPISYGLNSKLIKENGKIIEKKWKVGGMYTAAIEKIVFWLDKAATVAENAHQKKIIQTLAKYYRTGNLKDFDEYNILWVKDTTSVVDAVNGFIEVYSDPIGHKGAYESIVSFKDMEASKRIDAISSQAQWFEDNSPIMPEHKKKHVVGISAKVITVVVESGESSPSTPIGINLPNANWIRKEYGSKSVNLGNIVYAYNQASAESQLKEFCYSQEEIDIAKKYGPLANDLHTDMHEVIGHGSGQINEGVGAPKQSLKNYASTIEEARADLVALYYLPDQKLVEIGVIPNNEAFKAEYDKYIRNGLILQLQRIKPGENIEESHMRNRQLISLWAYERGKKENVIEKKVRDGKTYFVINDYMKLRIIFGELLRKIQKITSEGDFNSAKEIVEQYGVKVDPVLHKEVIARFEKLNIAPYKGFINPVLTPVKKNGKITDIKVEYPEDFATQMLYYSKKYSYLPIDN
ncbi:MAG: dihydrofolate reductase [Ignavibacteriaceae bacterium]|nr:dihydrofolate reductase [Ignavibacteriaceae bacterium]